jgi:hypothetical protein
MYVKVGPEFIRPSYCDLQSLLCFTISVDIGHTDHHGQPHSHTKLITIRYPKNVVSTNLGMLHNANQRPSSATFLGPQTLESN